MPDAEIRILLVDDDEAIRTSVPDDLEARLTDRHGIDGSVEPVATVDDVWNHLESHTYNLLIIDLKLDGGRDGTELINEILDKQVLPLFIYSAFTEDLPETHEDHGFIKIFEKSGDEQLDRMADRVARWHESGALEFFSERGLVGSVLRRTLARTMWDNVSKYWRHFDTDDREIRERSAVRLASNLLHDEFMSRDEFRGNGGEVSVHHGEIYILDTPREYLALGDLIVKEAEGHQIVLSPSCDLIPRPTGGAKANTVLFAECVPFEDFAGRYPEHVVTKFRQIQDEEGSSNHNKAKDYFSRMMRHSKLNDAGQYFFLPPFAHFDGGVIDFTGLDTVPYVDETCERLVEDRLLTLNREVSAELGSRFVRYMLRLGQPAYDEGPLANAMARLGSRIVGQDD